MPDQPFNISLFSNRSYITVSFVCGCTKSCVTVLFPSDGNRADEDTILQQNTQDEEHKVQYEHGEAQLSAHLPPTGGDGDNDKEEHQEEQHNGAEQAIGADHNWLTVVEQGVYQPRDRQTKTKQNRSRNQAIYHHTFVARLLHLPFWFL